MKKQKFFFAVLLALLIAPRTNAQVSLRVKLSSSEHGEQILTYDIPDVNTVNGVSFTMRFVKGSTFTIGFRLAL